MNNSGVFHQAAGWWGLAGGGNCKVGSGKCKVKNEKFKMESGQ